MGRAADRSLFLRPAQRVQAERRPVLVGIAARINLLLEPQQTEMAGLMRAESRNLHIIVKQIRPHRDLVIFTSEKLFLVIEARSPGEVAADLQILPLAMADNVGL